MVDITAALWARVRRAQRYGTQLGVVLLQWLRSMCITGGRSFFHLGVLLLIVLSVSLSEFEPLQWTLSVNVNPPTTVPTASPRIAASSPLTSRGAERQPPDLPDPPAVPAAATLVQNLVRAPVPHTIIPERPRKNVITYTVQSGDNVFGIAQRFALQHETIAWSDPELETDPDMLYIGQVLNILPVDGVYHTVGEGETLEEIAKQYSVSVEAITQCEYNGFSLDDYGIQPGQKLIVPGGVKPFKPRTIHFDPVQIPDDALRGSGSFVWPVGGYVSQGYWNLHRAIDIAGPHGDVVVAADAGVVVYASWHGAGYGNLVIIDHGNGLATYYAHLYGFYVDTGQSVEHGQPIGARGSTGRSTGAHLHFEIRENDVHRSPMDLLPRQ
ncbi:MAG: M23 family metallopeptidase [Chloroflexi bacterium]|nr:M23 family metallopeptidase [Chloroflexota bacterium]